MTGCGKFFMISYIFQGILGNVVNLEFNSPFRIETRKGAHQDGCWIPLSRENGWCVAWLCNKRSVCWKGTFELKIMHLVLSNICGEYLCVFLFFGGLFNFLSCRLDAYSRVNAYFIIMPCDPCVWNFVNITFWLPKEGIFQCFWLLLWKLGKFYLDPTRLG